MAKYVVSHGDRVIYPGAGYTKADVVAHYERVADAMLPHLTGRPLTLVRHPKGIGSKGFFQKNAARHYPSFIDRIELPKRGGVTAHPAVSTREGLAYLANQGTISFHVPPGRVPHLGQPDRLVFDFDPPEGGFESARRAAWHAKALLDSLNVTSTPMVTGSKGYHVVIALEPTANSGAMTQVARKFAAVMIQRHPDILTEAFRKERREGRVFVDWMRNGMRATVVAPWSLRPRPGAPVAVPITWSELDATAPDAFRLPAVAERLAMGDPLVALEATDPAVLIAAAAELADDAGIVLEPFDRFRS
jgi:bifunctional non-homologous end joining protein LigD